VVFENLSRLTRATFSPLNAAREVRKRERLIGEPWDRTNLLFHCTTPSIICIHCRNTDQPSSYVTTRLATSQWGLLLSVTSFRNTSIRWMKLLPGSRRPTHPVHDPIQPALLEFSQEFDALYFHYVGKLNDSRLMPSWKQACKNRQVRYTRN
jgi:hypothetical protein